VTLADTLGEAGYTSGVIGKWHLGAHDNFHPLNRGFDFFYGFLGGGHLYYPDRLEVTDAGLGEEYRTKLLRNHERVEEEQYLTHAFSREAISFVERHQGEPFFLFLSYNAPHTPMHAPRDAEGDFSHIEDETRRTYAAMLQAVDQGVGKLLEKLAALDLEEETLVFFLSDNGGPQPVNGSDNSPLRGNKASVREGGFRVPFAMRWPGHLPEGETYREPVSSLDIYATARELAGAPQPEDKPLDGVNLLPYLRGEKDGAPHETLFWRRGGPDGRFAVRHGDMKLAIPGSGGKQLFNLAEDISESNNLASAKPEVVEALDRLRRQWSEQMMEPQFLGLAQEEQYEQRWREEHGKEE
jgi:arylsulfatase A-like enzyme